MEQSPPGIFREQCLLANSAERLTTGVATGRLLSGGADHRLVHRRTASHLCRVNALEHHAEPLSEGGRYCQARDKEGGHALEKELHRYRGLVCENHSLRIRD